MQAMDSEDCKGGVSISDVCLSNLQYADDTTLVASSIENMILVLQCLDKVGAKYGVWNSSVRRAGIKYFPLCLAIYCCAGFPLC